MEKYRRYADKATGINPFVPKFQSSFFSRLINGIFFPLRLALLLMFSPLLLVVDLFSSQLRIGLFFPFWLQKCIGFVAVVLNRLVLFTLGNVIVSSTPYPRSSAILPGGGTKSPLQNQKADPAPGDICLVNFQSPLDILVLESIWPGKACPFIYAHCHVKNGAKDKVSVLASSQKMAAWQQAVEKAIGKDMMGIRETISRNLGLFNVDMTTLQKEAKDSGRAVLLFPEGTSSNGKGILQFPNLRFGAGKIHVVSIQYSSPNIPHVVPSDFLSYLLHVSSGLLPFGLVSRPIRANVAILRPEALPPVPSVYSPAWSNDIRALMAKAGSTFDASKVCKPVECSLDEKGQFLAAWGAPSSTT